MAGKASTGVNHNGLRTQLIMHCKTCPNIEGDSCSVITFQCRQDFLSGKIGEFSKENQNSLAQVLLYEIVYLASTQSAHVTTKDVIENP